MSASRQCCLHQSHLLEYRCFSSISDAPRARFTPLPFPFDAAFESAGTMFPSGISYCVRYDATHSASAVPSCKPLQLGSFERDRRCFRADLGSQISALWLASRHQWVHGYPLIPLEAGRAEKHRWQAYCGRYLNIRQLCQLANSLGCYCNIAV